MRGLLWYVRVSVVTPLSFVVVVSKSGLVVVGVSTLVLAFELVMLAFMFVEFVEFDESLLQPVIRARANAAVPAINLIRTFISLLPINFQRNPETRFGNRCASRAH